ncbi:MAG: hypothetical protein VKJ04_09930 [Vampirovibrionales bacterium]|nr:hypothetical protein [Vampirovibrionales bacterium]
MPDPQVIQQFNEEKIAQRMSQKAKERFVHANTPDALLEEDVNIIYEFCKIAIGLVKNDLAGHVDEKHAKNLVILFIKCLTQAIIKCDQHKIAGDIKVRALQGLALDLYNLCKEYTLNVFQNNLEEAAQEEGRQQIRKATMQRLKFHIEEAKKV